MIGNKNDELWLRGLTPTKNFSEDLPGETQRISITYQQNAAALLLRDSTPEDAESLLCLNCNQIFISFFSRLFQFYGMLRSEMSQARSEALRGDCLGWRVKWDRINQRHVNHFYFLKHRFLIEYGLINDIMQVIESKFGNLEFKPETHQLINSAKDAADMVEKMRLE